MQLHTAVPPPRYCRWSIICPLSVLLLAQCANVSLYYMLLLVSLQVLDIVYFSSTTTPGGFLPQGATGTSPIFAQMLLMSFLDLLPDLRLSCPHLHSAWYCY